MSPPSWPRLSPRLILLDCHKAPGLSQCLLQQTPTGSPFYTWEWGVSVCLFSVRLPSLSFHHCCDFTHGNGVCQCLSFPSVSPHSPSTTVLRSVSASPWLPCKTSRCITTIFLDPIYLHQYTIFVFSLSDLLQIGPRFIQLIRTENSKVMHIWIGDAKEPKEKPKLGRLTDGLSFQHVSLPTNKSARRKSH